MADNLGGAGGLAAQGAGDDAQAAMHLNTEAATASAQQARSKHDAASPPGGTPVDGRGAGAPTAKDDPAEGGEASTSPELGAGGTSLAAEDPGDANGLDDKVGGAGKVAGAAAAVPVAAVTGQALVLMMFINYLKGLLLSLAAVAANLWNMAFGLLLAGAKALSGGVLGFGALVSGAVGGAISAATAGVASVAVTATVGAMLVAGAVAGVSAENDLALKDGAIDCRPVATNALKAVDGSDTNVDATTLANAKTVYSVLSAWGMPDANVAGILGNWDAESGVDPTSVQNIFNAPQQMTDEKKTAAGDTDNGIGLGQWTFGRNQALRTYASGHAKDWWTLESQLGFMISAAEGGNADIVKGMIAAAHGTPGEAALYFHDEWERSADTPAMAARRAEKANKWMGMFSGWEKNQSLADSILAQAGTTVGGANGSRAEAVRSECIGVGAAALTMKEGGLSLDEATQLMALYRVEGDAFLKSRYGAGGPGDCGNGDKADNCVGFSTYFVNKFTTFQQYARGDGIDTAGSMATMMGKPLTTTPTVYSVVSGPASGPEGHTFVVLGIEGDQAVIGEAMCGTDHAGTRARMMPMSELTSGKWKFVDVSDLMTGEPASA
ncbi:hypothetical protein SAMN06295974_3697 [Plantibacter flavus]|uniref:Phage tail lysozyme domain-containing protein n=1 Tax=Plantibacter flavus TaxID=150123 RepID=A0A3N2BL83_9MICO|nr:phage tail tip lysozyme [Plantibacter flavus]ROR75968.1 hypothetical protein EDD42_3919 [Plantibacter flavus]SMG48224.1 hypothetical protein SAMN06295974_3697 [Plantibacter flavus]